MSIQVHGLTTQMILDELPSSMASNISASSLGVNTIIIARWIQDVAGTFNAILESKGSNVDNLSENATRVIRNGMTDYVVGKVLLKSDYSSDSIAFRFNEYRAAKAELEKTTEFLGNSDSGSSIVTNVNTSEDTVYTFGDTFKF